MGCSESLIAAQQQQRAAAAAGAAFAAKLGKQELTWASAPKERNLLSASEAAFAPAPPLVIEDLDDNCNENVLIELKGELKLPPSASIISPSPVTSLLLTPRVFTEEERLLGWSHSGFDAASSGNAKPIALWIVGPSAVGKSTLSPALAPGFGIPTVHRSPLFRGYESETDDPALDAVVVDGAFFREVHVDYQRWVKTDQWPSAYPAYKKLINKEKDALLEAAAKERKHMLLPQTCLNLPACVAVVSRLAQAGYTNHVLGLVAPRDDVARRGMMREQKEGKRYKASEFDSSIAAIRPIIEACNGRFEVLRAVKPPVGQADSAAGASSRLSTILLASGSAGSEAEVRLPEDLLA